MQSEQQGALVCCLCGQSANAMDLGDLHGPYYSEGHQPSAKRSNLGSELKEESSESDSSTCSSGRKWTSTKGQQRRRWGGKEGRSLAAKRVRADTEDWYSPPMVPLGPCEYWLHEDCGVWAAGVFLVRGKVYGLEEAVRARCSSCGDKGASLGCLFKGCPNKYHYRCALHSDCVLEEDNFSMKCRKHKVRSSGAL
uniref:PHD-type domain-containing protein n=1 Tax=Periophthalmus magnuspinnatus TaxID=409849 RepID=A0A3B4B605_9GOBI